jgi:hypothetical protein
MIRLLLPLVTTLALAAADVPRFLVPNGDMTEGTTVPTGWEKTWTGSGVIATARDTVIFHTAPASLRVSTTGESRGNVTCCVEINGAHPINLQGFLRTTGTVKVQIYAEPYPDNWSATLGFLSLAWVPENPPDQWNQWTAQLNLPEQTAHVLISMMVEGNGSAWLDDVRDVREPEFQNR